MFAERRNRGYTLYSVQAGALVAGFVWIIALSVVMARRDQLECA